MKATLRYFRRIKVPHLGLDFVLIATSFYSSLLLRRGWEGASEIIPEYHRQILFLCAVKLVIFMGFRVYDVIWRYISFGDVVRVTQAIGMASVVNFFLARAIAPKITIYVFTIDLLLTGIVIFSARMLRRFLYERSDARRGRYVGRNTLLFGAGSDGRFLSQYLRQNPQFMFSPVGFIDDDPRKLDRSISGLRVLGDMSQLKGLVESLRVQDVIVAFGNPSGNFLRDLVTALRPHGVKIHLMTNWSHLNPDSARIDPVRKIELADLLSRPNRQPDLSSVRQLIEGRRVLVTGAGGSIGSELCRQIARMSPTRLLLLDHSETNLYQIDSELRQTSDDAQVTPLLIDIKDRDGLQSVFDAYSPEIVIHAAAYKHVHLVEKNSSSAIQNNVLGTHNLVEVAKLAGVHTFVLISTDKAVNPVGVMGTTKRLCELLVSQAGLTTGKNYCSVRFGNVLGSSGSLIPLLMKQIETGSPVTITHRDMTRYFMLIPEAVSLVLRAATLAQPGDIAVLRMGDSVRIVDIAKALIALMGRTESEVPIVFTGIRPGEKLFEELYIRGDELNTDDPDVVIVPKGDSMPAMLRPDLFIQNLRDLSLEKREISAVELQALLSRFTQTWGDGKVKELKVTPFAGPRHSSTQ